MASSVKKKQYDIAYAKNHLKRVPLDLRIEKYEEIKIHSEKTNESINGFIKRAIDEAIERDNQTRSTEPPETGGLHHIAWAQEPYQMPWGSDTEFKARITTSTEEPANAGSKNDL